MIKITSCYNITWGILFLAGYFLFGENTFAEQQTTTLPRGDLDLASAKGAKKRKSESPPPTSHSIQDSSPGGLYSAEVGGSFAFDSKKQESETNGNKQDPTNISAINLTISYLFILGTYSVGPDFNYYDTSSKDTGESKRTGLGLGVTGKYYFLDINKEKMVPFAFASMGYLSESSKYGDADESKSTGLLLQFGGGVDYFLHRGIAISPRLYYERMEKNAKDPDEKTIITGFTLAAGLSVFLE